MATTTIKFTIKDLNGAVVPLTRFLISSGRPESGAIPVEVPYQTEFVTDASGQALVTLEASSTIPYYISKKDGATEQIIAYKFFVPSSTQILEGDLLYVDLGTRSTKFNDASLAALIEAKVVATNAANNALQIVSTIGGVDALSDALSNISTVAPNVTTINVVAQNVASINSVSSNLPALLNTAALLSERGLTSPQQFGAVGNGEVDDSDAIQLFFDSVTTYGLKGIIPAGLYNLAKPVKINLKNPGFSIEGAGVESAIFTVNNTFISEAPAITICSNTLAPSAVNFPGFTIGGFSIKSAPDGFKGAATAGLKVGSSDASFAKIEGFQWRTIENILIANFPTALDISHARMITFKNLGLYLDSTPSIGVRISQNGLSTNDLIFDTCQIKGNSNTAGNINVKIESLVGPYNLATGTGSVSGINFKSCDFYSGHTAIDIKASKGATISDIWVQDGCQIDQEVTHSINIEADNTDAGGSKSVVENIYITDGWFNYAGGYGITLSCTGPLDIGRIQNVWISNCRFLRNQTIAITAYGYGDSLNGLNILDNQFINCGSLGGAIVLNGVESTTIRNNKAIKHALFSARPAYLVELVNENHDVFVIENSGLIEKNTINGAVLNNTSVASTNITINNNHE